MKNGCTCKLDEGRDGENYKIEDTNIAVACEIANVLQKHGIVLFNGIEHTEKRIDKIFVLVKELRRSYFA